jgi:hypothetical protein
MVATSNNQWSDKATSRLLGGYETTSFLMLSIPPEVPGSVGVFYPVDTMCCFFLFGVFKQVLEFIFLPVMTHSK